MTLKINDNSCVDRNIIVIIIIIISFIIISIVSSSSSSSSNNSDSNFISINIASSLSTPSLS